MTTESSQKDNMCSAFGVLAVSIPMALASRVEYESSKVEKRKLNGKQF